MTDEKFKQADDEYRGKLAISICNHWQDLLSRPDRAARLMRLTAVRLEAMDRTFASILEGDTFEDDHR